MVKSKIDGLIESILPAYHPHMFQLVQMGSMSCEQLAKRIGDYLTSEYSREFTVIVREDEESAGLFG